VRIKRELESLKVPTPTGKKKWPVKTIENILTNEKYTGTSVYGETESAEFPSTKRTVRDPFEVHRSRNHHPAIIHERRFKRVQKLKAKRSNIELDVGSHFLHLLDKVEGLLVDDRRVMVLGPDDFIRIVRDPLCRRILGTHRLSIDRVSPREKKII